VACHNLGVRFRLVALIALMLTGVVGCTSGGSNGPSGTLSTSAPTSVSTAVTSPISAPTPSPSVATTGPNVRPGEKPPVLPAAAKENTPVGSDLFARFWIESLDWAYATTDSALARSLYANSCTGCSDFVKNMIDSTRDHDQHFVGGRIAVVGSRIRPTDHRAHASAMVDLTVTQSALKVVSSAKKVVDTAPAVDRGTFRVWLRWGTGKWTVVDWKKVVTR
jgi:hypothetical protein